MNEININIVVEDEKLLPRYDHNDDAALNLYAANECDIPSGEHQLIPTGVRSEIPAGFAALIWDRSSMAHKENLTTIGGVIDAGYRGEWGVILHNLGNKTIHIEKYQKIAQAIIQKVEHVNIVQVAKISETARGEGGFGSTGKY